MDLDPPPARSLDPLPYHSAVVRHLREAEPEVWAWASSVQAREEHADAVRQQLLRHTYRLTPQSHPAVHAAAEQACRRLGLALPLTLYQGSDGAMNASLFFLPGEAQIVFSGPVLDKLSESELLALLGHELAHHRLWTTDGGAFHAADRILDHCAGDAASSPSLLHTARLYRLYTEIYADRGSALAAEASHPAIASLVKTQTGLPSVDPAAYLQQAEELDAKDRRATQEHSHPESFLRAQAVDRWWKADPGVDAWTATRIEGVLTMQQLDLVGQQRLRDLTRGLLALLLAQPRLATERARIQAREYFPDWSGREAPLTPSMLAEDSIDDGVRDYLCAVVLDFALVDPDGRDDALADAGRIASALGVEKPMAAALRKHLGLNKRAIDRLARQWTRPAP